MLQPKTFTSSYRQYKNDTDTVASWLAITAKRCGYPLESTTSQPSKSTRLKGKARKQAKSLTTSSKVAGQNDARPRYIIAIKDFEVLAGYIAAQSSNKVQVPEVLTSALDRAITVRKSFSALPSPYAQASAGKDASDDRHKHFISVLESVRDILRLLVPTPAAEISNRMDMKKDNQSSATANNVTNMFKNLDLFEPSRDFLEATDAKTPVGIKEEPKYEAGKISTIEEDFLAFHLFLTDLVRLRTLVTHTWTCYKERLINLIAASITTNTAIDLAESMEEELWPVFERQGGFEPMLKKLYVALCLQEGQEESFRERPSDELNFHMYRAASSIFIPTYLLIDGFSRVTEPGSVPIYKPGWVGTYDAASDRSIKSDREKFVEDKVVLAECFPLFCILFQGSNETLPVDKLTRGLQSMVKSRKTPLWLVFAAQVFLDIHHTLRAGVSQAFNDLYEHVELMRTSLTENLDFHSSLPIDGWAPSNDDILRGMLADMDQWVIKDLINEKREKLKIPSVHTSLRNQPHELFKRHPLLCGLLLARFRLQYHEAGVNFVNASGSIMYTGHLYNAIAREKLIEGRMWQDMEILMMQQDPTSFFVGDRPATPQEYIRRFVLAMGWSAKAFASNRRNAPPQASKSGPRCLSELGPVMQIFGRHLFNSIRDGGLSSQDIEKIIVAADWEEAESEDSLPQEKRVRDKVIITGRPNPLKGAQGPRGAISPILLLESVRNTVMAETLELSFDYLQFHRICWRLLRQVNEVCKSRLTKMVGPRYLEHENQLPFVVGYIFMAAVGTDELGTRILGKKKREDFGVTSALLLEAAGVMRQFLNAEGLGMAVTNVLKRLGMGTVLCEDEDEFKELIKEGSGEV